MGDAISTIIRYNNKYMIITTYPLGQFEEFLKGKFMLTEAGSMALDDNLQDAEERWFENLQVEELINYGDEYAKATHG